MYLSCCFLPRLSSFSPSSFCQSPLFLQSHLLVIPSIPAVYCHECTRTSIFTSWGEFPPPNEAGNMASPILRQQTPSVPRPPSPPPRVMLRGVVRKNQMLERAPQRERVVVRKGKKQGEWPVLYHCFHPNYSAQNDRCPASSQRQG